METTLFAFASDLEGEGLENVLDNVAGRAGVGGITLAAAYHHGRDIFPHNPGGRVRYLEGGTVFFQPDPGRYRGLRLQPLVSRLAAERDPLNDLLRAAGGRSLRVRAWAVLLHNYALGELHPECTSENAFGDRHLTDLCPANPDVRSFTTAICSDIASRGVAAITAESLHYHGLEHGFHHERYFAELGVLGRHLLGICFCEHCLGAARAAGVDGAGLRAAARAELEARFAADPAPEDPDALAELVEAFAGGELLAYHRCRAATVTSLVDEAARATAECGAELVLIDPSGAVKGYADGRPTGGPASEVAWRFGIDPQAIGRHCGLEAIAYAATAERVGYDLADYRRLVGEGGLSAIMRPMAPDCVDGGNLAAKLRVARDLGVTEVGFYHYGFMRLEALDLLRSAIGSL